MTGLNDLTAEADERWMKAGRFARGFADNGLGEALRIYYTRYFPVILGLYVALVVLIGILVTPLVAPWMNGPTGWRFVVLLAAPVFSLVAFVAGLTYNVKRLRRYVELPSSLAIVFPLEKEEQKYVRRVINGKEPVPGDPVKLQVARSVAVQNRKGHSLMLLLVPAYSYCISGTLGNLAIFWMIITAFFALLTCLFIREFRRAGRFLADTAP